MKTKIYYAGKCGAALDSDIRSGGGRDDTKEIQDILDKARSGEGVHLIMDGVSLVRGLKIYSNTTIECLNKSCGFFLADNSDCPIISTPLNSASGEKTKSISFIGGTYNHNCLKQAHHTVDANGNNYYNGHGVGENCNLTVAFFLTSVEQVVMKDVTVWNQRTYAVLFANWKCVHIDNVRIELPDRMHHENQDGFHFFGPGQFLTMRNVGGRTSDDFIALAPDENDDCSSITDVLIDGVCLDDADQAVRMLCHSKGRLDRVTVRNISGTYRSYGFFINPFWPSSKGSYGNIIIENVDLRQTEADYFYTPNFLFRIGGRVESLILRNISYHNPNDDRGLLDIGWQFYGDDVEITPERESRIGSVLIDGLHIQETLEHAKPTEYIKIKKTLLNTLTLRNVELLNLTGKGLKNTFIKALEDAKVKTLTLRNAHFEGITNIIDSSEGIIETVILSDILIDENCENTVVKTKDSVKKLSFSNMIQI